MKVIDKMRSQVEKSPWDSWILENEKWLNRASWAVIAIAAAYFGPVCCSILLR